MDALIADYRATKSTGATQIPQGGPQPGNAGHQVLWPPVQPQYNAAAQTSGAQGWHPQNAGQAYGSTAQHGGHARQWGPPWQAQQTTSAWSVRATEPPIPPPQPAWPTSVNSDHGKARGSVAARPAPADRPYEAEARLAPYHDDAPGFAAWPTQQQTVQVPGPTAEQLDREALQKPVQQEPPRDYAAPAPQGPQYDTYREEPYQHEDHKPAQEHHHQQGHQHGQRGTQQDGYGEGHPTREQGQYQGDQGAYQQGYEAAHCEGGHAYQQGDQGTYEQGNQGTYEQGEQGMYQRGEQGVYQQGEQRYVQDQYMHEAQQPEHSYMQLRPPPPPQQQHAEYQQAYASREPLQNVTNQHHHTTYDAQHTSTLPVPQQKLSQGVPSQQVAATPWGGDTRGPVQYDAAAQERGVHASHAAMTPGAGVSPADGGWPQDTRIPSQRDARTQRPPPAAGGPAVGYADRPHQPAQVPTVSPAPSTPLTGTLGSADLPPFTLGLSTGKPTPTLPLHTHTAPSQHQSAPLLPSPLDPVLRGPPPAMLAGGMVGAGGAYGGREHVEQYEEDGYGAEGDDVPGYLRGVECVTDPVVARAMMEGVDVAAADLAKPAGHFSQAALQSQILRAAGCQHAMHRMHTR